MTYEYFVEDKIAIRLGNYNWASFPNQLKHVSYTIDGGNTVVGRASFVEGTVTIKRPWGDVVSVTNGFLIYEGDEISTDASSSVIVADESGMPLFVINEGKTDTIKRWVNDQLREQDSYLYQTGEWLQGIYDGIIHPNEPAPEGYQLPVGVSGSVGGVAGGLSLNTSINASIFTDEEIDALNKAAVLTAGSPISLYTAVDVPDEAFTFDFRFGFLDSSGVLDVYIGDILLYGTQATDHILGEWYDIHLDIEGEVILNMGEELLTFRYDGNNGTELLLDDIMFGSLQNGDFSLLDAGWYSEGEGTVGLAALQITTVPIPAGVWLLGSALGLLGWMGRNAT